MPTLFGREWRREDLNRYFGDAGQIFGVRQVTCDNGPERGLRLLEFDTGCGFRFDVAVDRCMDITSMKLGQAAIGWHSPTGFRHPWLHQIDSEGGLGIPAVILRLHEHMWSGSCSRHGRGGCGALQLSLS